MIRKVPGQDLMSERRRKQVKVVMDHVLNRRKSAKAVFLPLIAGLWLLAEQSSFGEEKTLEPNGQSTAVDFERDIQPILKARCIKCHGEETQESGLRLDAREFAEQGGDSERPILGGTVETNEIFQRITAKELADRMPFGEEPLSEREIQLFREWVKAGTPWPHSTMERPTALASEQPPGQGGLWRQYGTPFYKWFYTSSIALEWAIAFLVFQLLILLNERAKRQQKPGLGMFRRIGPRHYALGFLLFFGVYTFSWYHGKTRRLSAEVEALTSSVQNQQTEIKRLMVLAGDSLPTVEEVYGNPPVPIRPRHPQGLSRVYYRGNDERSDHLFNGGFYRTATLEVELCDGEGNPLDVGDAVPESGLAIRFEFDRSPGTARRLFGTDLIDNVCLSRTYPRQEADQDPRSLVTLQVMEEGERWRAIFPLPGSGEEFPSKVSGLIYVYHQSRADFGIRYDLIIRQGVIEAGSDLWMGNLTVLANLALPRKDKIEQSEWFDVRPIPEIAGENSQDPELLGIPEHVPSTKEPMPSTSQSPNH